MVNTSIPRITMVSLAAEVCRANFGIYVSCAATAVALVYRGSVS